MEAIDRRERRIWRLGVHRNRPHVTVARIRAVGREREEPPTGGEAESEWAQALFYLGRVFQVEQLEDIRKLLDFLAFLGG
jgi:hypothetical protein